MSLITLCGRDHPLRFSLNALCALEEKAGCGLDEILRRPLSGIRGLLWCGLMDTEKGLTVEAAGELLARHLNEGGSLEDVSRALSNALEESGFFPPPGQRVGTAAGA